MRIVWIAASLASLVACGDDTTGGAGGAGAGSGAGSTSDGAGAGGGDTTGASTGTGASSDPAEATAYVCTTGCECDSFGLTFDACYQDCAAAQDEQRAGWADDPCAAELDAYASCLAFSGQCVDGVFRQDPLACRDAQDAVSRCQASADGTGSG